MLHHADSTRAGLKSILERFEAHVRECIQSAALISIESITSRIVIDYQRKESERTVSGRPASEMSVNRHIRHLRAIFNWAVGRGYLAKSPFDGVKLFRKTKKRVYAPDESELAKFYEYLDGPGKELFAAANYAKENPYDPDWFPDFARVIQNTGLRLEEALRVRPEDLRLGLSREPKSILQVTCWGDWQPKDREERDIPIGPKTLMILQRRMLANGKAQTIFARTDGRIPHKSSVSHAFALRAERAGVPQITVHSLRRLYATRAAEHLPEVALAKLLGHANIETTRKFYVAGYLMKLAAPPEI